MYKRDDIELIVQVAKLYYENYLNQEEIAHRLNISRQKVSRLLISARAQGIVKIVVYDPSPGDPNIGEEIKAAFKL
ncbi:MAG: sigma factor-like helix-turn-helix DNA-binding protein, partial [Anaerolineaceae bacterium]